MLNYAAFSLLFFTNLQSTSQAIDNADAVSNGEKYMEDVSLQSPIIPPSATVQLGVSTARIKDEDGVLEERFNRIIEEASMISRSIKYGLEREEEGASFPPSISSFFPLVGKLIRRDSDGKRTMLHFIVEMDGKIVQAEAIVKDIGLLSMQQLSAILQYPVSSISTISMQVVEESASWWKIGLIIGAGVLLLFLAWCCLFCYFNSCGRITFKDSKKEELYEDRSETIERMEGRNDEGGKSMDHTQLGLQKEEEGMRNEEEENRQREDIVVRDEMKRQVEQKRSEMVIKDEEKKEEEVSKIRQDSVESLEISEEAGDELQDDSSPIPVTSSRPRAAGLKRPMRAMDGRVIADSRLSEWTTFSAGDRVNAIFSIRPPSSYEHPTPSPSTLNGVVQYSTSQGQTPFANFL